MVPSTAPKREYVHIYFFISRTVVKPYEAMTNVAKAEKQSAFRPLIYICSPFSGDRSYNTEQARKYSRFAYEQNAIPMTPHLLYPQFMSDDNPVEREDAMHFNYVLLEKCR